MTQPWVNVLPPGRESTSGMERSQTPGSNAGAGAGTLELNPTGGSSSYDPPQRASTSRRPSGASVHSQGATVYQASALGYAQPHSPASVSSSSTYPWATPRDLDDSRQQHQQQQQRTQSPQTGMTGLPSKSSATGAGPMPIQQRNQQLPRISTPANDELGSEDGGPRSAPASSPLSGPVPPFGQHGSQPPPRSSSTPDPRSTSGTSSPTVTSPTAETQEGRFFPAHPGPPHIHDASHHVHQSQAQGGFSAPRAAFMSNTPSNSSSTAVDSTSGAGQSRRSETPTSMSSAHGPATTNATVSNAAPNQTTKRSGSVTYCAKCGLAVRGQFVRALHQVYHLDCFRCKVSFAVASGNLAPLLHVTH